MRVVAVLAACLAVTLLLAPACDALSVVKTHDHHAKAKTAAKAKKATPQTHKDATVEAVKPTHKKAAHKAAAKAAVPEHKAAPKTEAPQHKAKPVASKHTAKVAAKKTADTEESPVKLARQIMTRATEIVEKAQLQGQSLEDMQSNLEHMKTDVDMMETTSNKEAISDLMQALRMRNEKVTMLEVGSTESIDLEQADGDAEAVVDEENADAALEEDAPDAPEGDAEPAAATDAPADDAALEENDQPEADADAEPDADAKDEGGDDNEEGDDQQLEEGNDDDAQLEEGDVDADAEPEADKKDAAAEDEAPNDLVDDAKDGEMDEASADGDSPFLEEDVAANKDDDDDVPTENLAPIGFAGADEGLEEDAQVAAEDEDDDDFPTMDADDDAPAEKPAKVLEEADEDDDDEPTPQDDVVAEAPKKSAASGVFEEDGDDDIEDSENEQHEAEKEHASGHPTDQISRVTGHRVHKFESNSAPKPLPPSKHKVHKLEEDDPDMPEKVKSVSHKAVKPAHKKAPKPELEEEADPDMPDRMVIKKKTAPANLEASDLEDEEEPKHEEHTKAKKEKSGKSVEAPTYNPKTGEIKENTIDEDDGDTSGLVESHDHSSRSLEEDLPQSVAIKHINDLERSIKNLHGDEANHLRKNLDEMRMDLEQLQDEDMGSHVKNQLLKAVHLRLSAVKSLAGEEEQGVDLEQDTDSFNTHMAARLSHSAKGAADHYSRTSADLRQLRADILKAGYDEATTHDYMTEMAHISSDFEHLKTEKDESRWHDYAKAVNMRLQDLNLML